MAHKLYTCIVFFYLNSKPPLKYRNVNNLDRFNTFAESRGGYYFNVYEKVTRRFVKRVYVNKKTG